MVQFDESLKEFTQLVDDRISTLQTEHDHGYLDKGNVVKEMMHLKKRYGEIHKIRKKKER